MKTATVADLRNRFPRIERWLKQGEHVQITKRGLPVATLLPTGHEPEKKFELPDFAARLKRIWGDRVFSDQEVEEMRRYEAGDEE